MKKSIIQISTYLLVFLLAFFVLMLLKAWSGGEFDSVESFQAYMLGYGIFAPVMLALFQAAQVVIPVLPGFLGCAAGAVMFGSVGGFWCNYIGISAGSIIAFLLARKYGTEIVKEIFKGGKYDKWADRAARSKSYAAFMFAAILLPLFPDDYLCYLSGLTKLSTRKFICIILLGKPWCILAYSFGFSLIGS
jgi:uncharacterized membrane protein YdjX (TVP38/TMEM64 family)